jgi:N-acetylmuramate 1-kinase
MTRQKDNRRDDPRLNALNHWLAGVLGAHVRASRPLSSDASFRRYFRVRDAGHRWIVMDAPPEQEHPADFVRIAGCLERLGLTVPRVLAADPGAGFLLLEDLGDRTFSRALAAGDPEQDLYTLAVDTLATIQNRWTGTCTLEPPAPYDEVELLREARLLVDWYWPRVTGSPCPEDVCEAFELAWRQAMAPVYRLAPVLVLRDFHVDNLMVIPGRHGITACGLLDFQDARLGCPAYDLVSLLRDARRDVPEPLARNMLVRFLRARPDLDRRDFETAYWILGAQRNTKIIGIFTRLWQRDGKPGYLRYLPRLWRLLEEELTHPALMPVRRWYDTHLPPGLRRALRA